VALKYFDWDDAKNAKLRAERGIRFEDIVFLTERGGGLDILEHPNASRYRASASSSSVKRTTRTSCRSSKTSTRLPQDDHPDPKATKQYLVEESDHEA
jgi:hypothetical protein